MLVVDAHVHVGRDLRFNVDCPIEKLLPLMQEKGVDISVVQPQCGSPTLLEDHKIIAELSRKYPGKIYGMASFDPVAKNFEELCRWAIEDLNFVGLKLHTYGFSVYSNSEYGIRVFECANQLKVPVMVHTGKGVPMALPSLILPAAKKFPNLPIIMAHAGGYIYFQEAVVVAQECPNIFLESSWVTAPNLKQLVDLFGSERILFGSDSYENLEASLSMYRSLNFSPMALESCLGKTAKKLFKL